MAGDVRAGGPTSASTGYAFSAPLTSTRPTQTAGVVTMDAAYLNLGKLDETFISVTTARGTVDIRDANLDTVLAVQESNDASLGLVFMSRSVAAMKAIFGAANVETDVGTPTKIKAIHYTGEELPHMQFAFIAKDATGPRVFDVGDGQITDVGPFNYAKTGAVTYPATIKLFKDATGRFYSELGE